MKVIVTGAAGFIGSNIVKELNRRGVTDIVAVDNLTRAEKMPNLADCEIADYLDKQDFIERVRADEFDVDFTAVLHQGACSDTMETDGRYMMENNYRYSLDLMDWCQRLDIPFIYASSASVYGAGRVFRESREHEGPHKGRMASVAFHFFNQYLADGRVRLFEGSDGFGPGEQIRDFVSVEDAVKVNLFFLDHPEISGIFNVGTGKAQSFNDVACATVNAVRRSRGEVPLALAQLCRTGVIDYIAFPPQLVGKYQSFTQADVSSLRAAGYGEAFLSVEEGVGRYVASRLAGEGAR